MKKSLSLALLAISVLAGTAQAQYLTSTRAGFVNNTDGKVYVMRSDSADGEKGRASMGTQLREGDQLSTMANSRAEVLLNPGSYLRINENSEIRAVSTSFSEVRMELLKGSAMVEIGQIDKKEPIEIITPNGTLTLTKDTLLRIDVAATETRVSVRQGEVYAGSRGGSRAANRIGRGKTFSLRGGATADVAKLNKNTADSFDVWSFNRAQTLTAANVQALRRTPTFSAFNGGWYFDPFYNCYTFIPSRGRYFSPYGFGFFNNYGDCYWYNPFFYGNGWNNNNWGGGGGSVATNLPPRVVTGADRAPIRREPVGRTLDSGGSIFDSGRAGGFGDTGGRAISMPASSAPTVTVSAPAPARGGDSGGGTMPSRP
ncbi:MAG: FecR family protein [Blastocatellia bacterium]|nr:FecR family protein [Blastocatellia bacterium]